MLPHVFRCVNNCFLWVIYVGQQFCSIFPLYEVLYLSFDAQLYLVISLLCACSSSISTYKAQCTHKTTRINWWMSIKPWNSLIPPGINCNELAGDLPKASWSYNVPLKIFKTPTFSLFTQCQSVTTATLAGLPIDRSDHATCDWIRFNTIQCNLALISHWFQQSLPKHIPTCLTSLKTSLFWLKDLWKQQQHGAFLSWTYVDRMPIVSLSQIFHNWHFNALCCNAMHAAPNHIRVYFAITTSYWFSVHCLAFCICANLKPKTQLGILCKFNIFLILDALHLAKAFISWIVSEMCCSFSCQGQAENTKISIEHVPLAS